MTTTNTEVGVPPPSAKGNFPPFDATTFVPQLFWLAVMFTLLYVLLDRVALPGVVKAMTLRRDRIADDLNTAEALRKEASQALEAYESALGTARAEAVAITSQAANAIKAEAERRSAELDAEIAAQIKAAEADIARAKDEALKRVRAVAIDVTGAIVEKMLGESVSADTLARTVDDELAA